MIFILTNELKATSSWLQCNVWFKQFTEIQERFVKGKNNLLSDKIRTNAFILSANLLALAAF